eukprot:SAG22_NODE_3329_length_1775_cov_6.273866_4_plen_128_part_01
MPASRIGSRPRGDGKRGDGKRGDGNLPRNRSRELTLGAIVGRSSFIDAAMARASISSLDALPIVCGAGGADGWAALPAPSCCNEAAIAWASLLMATVGCESSGTARKGRETQGKAMITAFKSMTVASP